MSGNSAEETIINYHIGNVITSSACATYIDSYDKNDKPIFKYWCVCGNCHSLTSKEAL